MTQKQKSLQTLNFIVLPSSTIARHDALPTKRSDRHLESESIALSRTHKLEPFTPLLSHTSKMSSSPPAEVATNDNNEPQKNALEQITFRFCQECSNMLYPKEDKVNSTLQYVCRHCFWSEPASSACIFRNNLNNSVGETAGVTQDVGSDPTVGYEYYFCILCGEEIGFKCFVCGEMQGVGSRRGGTDADEIRGGCQEFVTTMEGRVVGTTA
ncbi:hypothetical protein GP486_002823 [Trichoglossum hirsutum]|uniref:DNA-directed RNA polymerase II subunit RPB9-like zinc ribbon domain-containing protein n=1 Tax=Trichoglossum hirsutum TaxID=265104 RepID=A0A9P8RRC9_9PEZI|nr:hypothetical protein GP486_002823 [Trichoglossum hirsutum]